VGVRFWVRGGNGGGGEVWNVDSAGICVFVCVWEEGGREEGRGGENKLEWTPMVFVCQIHMFDSTHSHVWHGSFINVT